MAYKEGGCNVDAVNAIATLNSDGDGYTDAVEIAANRFPGDLNDDHESDGPLEGSHQREQLLKMPQRSQFMLMNTHKSEDFYTKYSGVAMDRL